jgi:hypothetical protein
MTKPTKSKEAGASAQQTAIVEVTVGGFKSISEERSVEIRPLTILAGANSSGKSSLLQPLLLLKQTLEAPYDPGPLLLNGPNVKFTLADQLLSRIGKRHSTDIFVVGARDQSGQSFKTSFQKENGSGFRVDRMEVSELSTQFTVRPNMSHRDICNLSLPHGEWRKTINGKETWSILRNRCLLRLELDVLFKDGGSTSASHPLAAGPHLAIARAIHLPGLRGNPERNYPLTSIGPSFPGTFEQYTASIISHWRAEKKEDLLAALNADLKALRLTGGVTAVRQNDVQIELYVGRLPDIAPNRPEDRVNIADVGVGVSQTLPILVALHAAAPGQLVYIEQPETHLHPRAQVALAQVLAAAATRGVRVVAETHSSILLLGVQTLVAQGKLAADLVKLHWFARAKDGRTTIQSADMDEAGRFPDWPEDFDDVILETHKAYLDAADKRLFAQ